MITRNAGNGTYRRATRGVRASFVAIAVLAFGAPPAPAQVSDFETTSGAVWAISETTPCVGLTARWAVAAEDLDSMLAPGHAPALSPDDKGTLMLFAFSCPASVIDGSETGPVSSAHLVIPLAPSRSLPTVPSLDEGDWLAVPWTIGQPGNPVADLFGRFAFAVALGDISFTWHPGSDGSPAGARFKITSEGGEIDVAAQFESEPTPAGGPTGLIDARGRPMDILFAHGPERSFRYSGGRGRVSVQGETVLAPFDLDPAEARFSLDVDFTWDFTFVSGAGRR